MSKKDYCVGFAFNDGRVALIMKNRPDWQKGVLNGIGGKLEAGESAFDAMVREFYEETGVQTTNHNWSLFARLVYPEARIYFFKSFMTLKLFEQIRSNTDEEVYVVHLDELNDWATIHNLSWLIPFAFDTEVSYSILDIDANHS